MSTSGPINVVFASDENYAPHLGVHIRSIAETTPEKLSIYILEKNIHKDTKDKILRSVEEFDVSINYISVDFKHKVGKKTHRYINEVALYRILIGSLLPSIDRAIYVDVDAIAYSSLVPLWNEALDGKIIGLVESPLADYKKYKRLIGLAPGDPYFNSGTMLVDLKALRAANLETSMVEYFLKHRDTTEYPDQDVINVVLKGKIKPLHPKWSVVRSTYSFDGQVTTYGRKEVLEARARPGIAQFSGKRKPWNLHDRHPLGYVYNAVRQRTAWAKSAQEYGDIPESRPSVSVVMATNNGMKYIDEAIQSIITQSLPDFEFLIVDDGSVDGTSELLDNYAKQDSRIVVLRNENRAGLPASLNKALEVAKGRYIARMDDDDISERERLAEQVRFMDDNPDIHFCGTNVTVIRPFWYEPKEYSPAPPERDEEIKVAMLHRPGLIHPTVMMRGDYVRAKKVRYNPEYAKAQDYELWTRLAFEYQARFHNIQKPLFRYRGKMTDPRETRIEQANYANRIMRRTAMYLGMTDDNLLDLHARWAGQKFTPAEATTRYREIALHVKQVLEANKEHQLFNQKQLEKVVMAPYRREFKDFHRQGVSGLRRYNSFPLRKFLKLSNQQVSIYRLRAYLREIEKITFSLPIIGLPARLLVGLLFPNKVFGKSP